MTTTPSSPTQLPKRSNIIHHINGFIGTLDTQTLHGEFKLTNKSYQTTEFLLSEWNDILVSDLQQASACFFVGYSLYDIDIQRILTKIKSIREKCFFVFKEYPDEVLEARVRDFGGILIGGYAKLAVDLEEEKKTFTPQGTLFRFNCFSLETKDKYINAKHDRVDVFDLITFGKINANKVFTSVANNFDNEYCIIRDCFFKIKKQIENGTRHIFIDSDLGNGKTILVEAIKAFCVHNGFRCYTLNKEQDTIAREFSEIYANPDPQIIFVDGFNRFKKVLEGNQFQRPEGTIFIFTDRTALAEINARAIKRMCGDDLFSISINKIINGDLVKLIQLLRANGLLGEFAGFTDERCLAAFNRKGLTSFLNIILYLYESSDHIKAELEKIIRDIQSQKGYAHLLAAILIFSFLNCELSLDEILEIAGISGNRPIIFSTDSSVRQLLDTDYSTITAKSSILAQYILTNKMLSEDTVSMLVKIYRYCSDNKHKNRVYNDVVSELNRFSTLQKILSKDDTLHECVSYFDSIKKSNSNEKNPSFWLQYAIAHTVNNSFERASEYFKTAMSRLGNNNSGVKLYIDNYFARFLLQRSMYNDRYYDFDEFMQVASIVSNQIIDQETLYYPYRIILNYKKYYAMFKSRMSDKQKDFILTHCKHVSRTSRPPAAYDRNFHRITEALEDLNSLMSQISPQ